jgi:hypothetical protein
MQVSSPTLSPQKMGGLKNKYIRRDYELTNFLVSRAEHNAYGSRSKEYSVMNSIVQLYEMEICEEVALHKLFDICTSVASILTNFWLLMARFKVHRL